METEPIITVMPDGRIAVGAGYNIGQVLEALEVARRSVLGVVLRPEQPTIEPTA
jgi:hypothetical protein